MQAILHCKRTGTFLTDLLAMGVNSKDVYVRTLQACLDNVEWL